MAVFTRSAITPPKVNRFGWNLEHSEYIVGLALAYFGRDPRGSDSWRARRNILSGKRTHDFTDFPSAKFHEIWTQHVDRCRDETIRNRILKIVTVSGRFFKQNLENFPFLATSGHYNFAMIADRQKFTSKITLYGISSFYFYRWNQFKPGLYTPYKKPPQIFCDVWRGLTTRQITLTSLSRRQPITIDYWVM